MCKGAELALVWGFPESRLSPLWLSPLIPNKVVWFTTHLADGVDLVEFMIISCEVLFFFLALRYFSAFWISGLAYRFKPGGFCIIQKLHMQRAATQYIQTTPYSAFSDSERLMFQRRESISKTLKSKDGNYNHLNSEGESDLLVITEHFTHNDCCGLGLLL